VGQPGRFLGDAVRFHNRWSQVVPGAPSCPSLEDVDAWMPVLRSSEGPAERVAAETLINTICETPTSERHRHSSAPPSEELDERERRHGHDSFMGSSGLVPPGPSYTSTHGQEATSRARHRPGAPGGRQVEHVDEHRRAAAWRGASPLPSSWSGVRNLHARSDPHRWERGWSDRRRRASAHAGIAIQRRTPVIGRRCRRESARRARVHGRAADVPHTCRKRNSTA
jgi:hypothetical protein